MAPIRTFSLLPSAPAFSLRRRRHMRKGDLNPHGCYPTGKADDVTSDHLRSRRTVDSGFLTDLRSELTPCDLRRGSSGGSTFKEKHRQVDDESNRRF